jgi:hypothetical protein
MSRKTSLREPLTKKTMRWPESTDEVLKEAYEYHQKNKWTEGETVACYFRAGWLEAKRKRERNHKSVQNGSL